MKSEEDWLEKNVCWQLGMKHLYLMGKISEEEFKNLFNVNFDVNKIMTERDLNIFHSVIEILETPKNISKVLEKESHFIITGEIKNNLEWTLWIYTLLQNGMISDTQYEFYKNNVDFNDKELLKENFYLVDEVLNIIRLKVIKTYPETINYIENPSFDVLIAANQMELV